MPRLHPFSAVISAGQRGAQLGSTGLFAAILLAGPLGMVDTPVAIGLAFLGVVVGVAYGFAWYLRFEYELTADELVVESGVFARQDREIPLRRIQNVDVSRSLLQRALGLAVVRFETAGGSTTEAELNAVTETEATRLQREIGDRRRDTESMTSAHEEASAQQAEDRPDESQPELLYAISRDELLRMSAISFRPGALGIPFLGAPFADDVVVWLVRAVLRATGAADSLSIRELASIDPLRLALAGGLLFGGYLLAAWIASGILTFVRFYGFRLEREGEELRYQRGLASRYSGTIPLEKLQTVTVGENVLMRWLGYANLAVETAGYAPGGGRRSAGGAETTVPFAKRQRVLDLADSLQPFDAPEFERPPSRARHRYARRFGIGLLGLAGALVAIDRVLVSLPALAPFVPLAGLLLTVPAARAKWRHRGVDQQPSVLITRSGFWRRRTRIVPYYRLQTVFVTRTLFQRRWNLASVTADTASTASLLGGDATAFDLDHNDALPLRDALLERLRTELARRRRRRAQSRQDPPVWATGAPSSADTTGDDIEDGGDEFEWGGRQRDEE